MKRFIRRQLVPSFAIGVAVYTLIFGVQYFGWLQRWELSAYDELIRLRAQHDPAVPDGRIVIIGITEEDLRRFGHPLDDEQLAALIEFVRSAQPRAIGLDLYRDLAEPRDRSKFRRLDETLRTTKNLIAIFSLKDASGKQIPPPPSLVDLPDRLGFNDFPLDQNVIRRALLYSPNGIGDPYQSLALRLALLYLKAEGIYPTAPDLAHLEWVKLGKATLRPFGPNDGGYVGADAAGFQMLLDFRFPKSFTTFAYGDVVAGRVPLDALRDRIVLVANNAKSVKDNMETPLNPDSRGILLHAQITNQLLREALLGDPQIKVLSDWNETLLGLCCTLLGAVIGRFVLRWPISAFVGLVGAFLGLAWLGRFTFYHGWWIPSVAPVMGYVAGAACSFGLVAFLEKREFRELMQIFSRHVSGKVARSLWQDREKFLDGNRPRSLKLTASVLFTDYVNFSSVAEDMEPVALLDWMNTGMERLAKCVENHDGIIVRYMGDSIMAVFGAPVPRDSQSEVARDAQSAVRCALAMEAEVEDQNRRWTAEGLPEIAMRIGVYTGSVVAGCIGSSARLEFTVTGDTVNTASRLESTKKDEISPPPGRCCRILVGEATHEFLGGLFEAEFVGEEALKGKAKKIKVFRVVGEQVAGDAERLSPIRL